MLQAAGLSLTRLLRADSMIVAAASGGIEVESREEEKVQLLSVIQLDGDIVTFVDADFRGGEAAVSRHFAKVEAALGRLLASVESLRAAIVAALGALVALANLPGLLEAFEEAAPWLLPQLLAAATVVLVPKVRRKATTPFLRPLLRWLLRSYARKMLRGAAS